MASTVKIGDRLVGDGQPCYVIAEIGINHNGEIDIAKKLISAAMLAGVDAVKFQKRTPELCVPPEQRNLMRDTPWGTMTYMDYRYRVEFGRDQYEEISKFAKINGVAWFASAWDEPSVDFMEQFNPPCYKIASACLTDDELLRHHKRTGRPIILSTGMSSIVEIDHAVEILGTDNLVLLHAVSTYPADVGELNLRAMFSLKERYGVPVGYSGHEVGLAPTLVAASLGACLVERHITLDRAMWGSDQAASVEPQGFTRLVRDIRSIERAMGDGVKRVYESEKPLIAKLRRKKAPTVTVPDVTLTASSGTTPIPSR
jgi:N-acetylneuraminate synthase